MLGGWDRQIYDLRELCICMFQHYYKGERVFPEWPSSSTKCYQSNGTKFRTANPDKRTGVDTSDNLMRPGPVLIMKFCRKFSFTSSITYNIFFKITSNTRLIPVLSEF